MAKAIEYRHGKTSYESLILALVFTRDVMKISVYCNSYTDIDDLSALDDAVSEALINGTLKVIMSL